MTPERRLALLAGLLYLLTFATSIPALALKTPFLDGSAGADDPGVRVAIALELVLALACVGTAVAMHPILHASSPALALAFVASRTVEAALVLLGVVTLLASLALGGAQPTLVALHDQAFLVGPGLIPAVNAAIFATALLRARLVPRIIPIVGLVGAPLLLLSVGATIVGALDQVSPVAALLALPIAVWEFAIGVWLVVRGTRATA